MSSPGFGSPSGPAKQPALTKLADRISKFLKLPHSKLIFPEPRTHVYINEELLEADVYDVKQLKLLLETAYSNPSGEGIQKIMSKAGQYKYNNDSELESNNPLHQVQKNLRGVTESSSNANLKKEFKSNPVPFYSHGMIITLDSNQFEYPLPPNGSSSGSASPDQLQLNRSSPVGKRAIPAFIQQADNSRLGESETDYLTVSGKPDLAAAQLPLFLELKSSTSITPQRLNSIDYEAILQAYDRCFSIARNSAIFSDAFSIAITNNHVGWLFHYHRHWASNTADDRDEMHIFSFEADLLVPLWTTLCDRYGSPGKYLTSDGLLISAFLHRLSINPAYCTIRCIGKSLERIYSIHCPSEVGKVSRLMLDGDFTLKVFTRQSDSKQFESEVRAREALKSNSGSAGVTLGHWRPGLGEEPNLDQELESHISKLRTQWGPAASSNRARNRAGSSSVAEPKVLGKALSKSGSSASSASASDSKSRDSSKAAAADVYIESGSQQYKYVPLWFEWADLDSDLMKSLAMGGAEDPDTVDSGPAAALAKQSQCGILVIRRGFCTLHQLAKLYPAYISPEFLEALVTSLASNLSVLHQRCVVHGDIRSENIMFMPGPGKMKMLGTGTNYKFEDAYKELWSAAASITNIDCWRLIDFGFAQILPGQPDALPPSSEVKTTLSAARKRLLDSILDLDSEAESVVLPWTPLHDRLMLMACITKLSLRMLEKSRPAASASPPSS